PWGARRSAIARPIPREPPVTTALLPDRSIIRTSRCGEGSPYPARGEGSADRLTSMLRFSGDDVVEWNVDRSGAGHQLRERVGDRVDRVPVDWQPDADVLRPDRRVAGPPAGRIGRPVDRHGAAREARSEGDD